MKFYGSIEKAEKQTDGTLIIFGYASSEVTDVDGEIIKADAIKAALPEYMKFANIREMHQPKAAGTALEMEVQEDGRTFIKAHIVDSDAVLKVENKVYKGFSIGGKVTERDTENKKIIKGIRLSEISLVDRPANPEAVFTISKVDLGADGEDDDATKVAKDAQKPADDATKAEETAPKDKKDAPAEDKKPEEKTEEENIGAGNEGKADKAADLKKGMYEIGTLASLLSSISYLQKNAEYERKNEGDASTMPEDLKAWLNAGATLLVKMVGEETAELIGAEKEVVVEVISMGERAKDLIKAAWGKDDAEKFIKGFDTLTSIAKAGARNSKADQQHIDAIHSASIALGASCSTDKAAGSTDDLKKRDEDFAKLQNENTELKTMVESFAKRVKTLEELPAPPKAALKVVEKGKDSSLPDGTTEKVEDKPADATDALKKVWKGGGKAA